MKPSAPGDGSYTYGMATPANGQSTGQYLLTTPTSKATVPDDFVVDFDAYDVSTGSTVFGADPGITVRYCTDNDDSLCSDWSAVKAADSGQAWQVKYEVTALTNTGCVIGGTLKVAVDATSVGLAEGTVTSAQYDVSDGNGGRTWASRDGAAVPADATQTRNVNWTIAWTAAATKNLPAVSGTLAGPFGCSAASAPTN